MTNARFKVVLVAFASLIFLGCTENSEVGNRTTVVNGYTVIDSRAWTDSYRNRIYWIDEENILFTGSSTISYDEDNSLKKVLVWDVKKNNIYPLNHDGMVYCYKNGQLRYPKTHDPDDKYSVHQYTADFVKENGRYRLVNEKLVGDFDYRFDGSCNLTVRPSRPNYQANLDILPEYDLVLRPIDDEEEKYVKNKRLGIYKDNQLLQVLPIRERQLASKVKYSTSHDLYFFKTGVQPDDTQPGRSPWPRDKPRPVYYFGRDLKLNRIFLPDDWLNSSRLTFFWGRDGFVASGFAKQENKEVEGLYWLKDQDIELVIQGRVFGGRLFRDGCQFAFAYEPDVVSGFNSNKSEITVKAINLCNKERSE